MVTNMTAEECVLLPFKLWQPKQLLLISKDAKGKAMVQSINMQRNDLVQLMTALTNMNPDMTAFRLLTIIIVIWSDLPPKKSALDLYAS